ncbi:unnamed protein product [Acanthoscelides obtectus]|uniref:Uncharacterized protein n=1 Tax=Acanthoscelides obtectus TaxID=200917 RepID=A0A9P0L0N0_ACAOB|nr:unnamed protein product [Acanthoscelides obtectus]CAK1681637.1 hypothetical protein AOBTE_LOCUS33181 [Acanthoscelides obtectus]
MVLWNIAKYQPYECSSLPGLLIKDIEFVYVLDYMSLFISQNAFQRNNRTQLVRK